jgi:hypothetical protein
MAGFFQLVYPVGAAVGQADGGVAVFDAGGKHERTHSGAASVNECEERLVAT